MSELNIKSFEEKILNLICQQLSGLKEKLLNVNLEADTPNINSHGSGSSYYSEIEFNIWKNNNLKDSISIVLFINGNVQVNEDEAIDYLKTEMLEVIG